MSMIYVYDQFLHDFVLTSISPWLVNGEIDSLDQLVIELDIKFFLKKTIQTKMYNCLSKIDIIKKGIVKNMK